MKNGLPRFQKTLADLVPGPQDVLSRARSVVLGTLASLGLLGLGASVAKGSSTSGVPVPTVSTTTLLDRQKKTTKLVLTLGQQTTLTDLGHTSHRSHSSHSSHRSHSSHYSGSSPGAGAPRTSSTPIPAVDAASTTTSETVGIVAVIQRVDKEKRIFFANTDQNLKLEFQYRDDTVIGHTGSSIFERADELIDGKKPLPLRAGLKVRVQWKKSTDGKKRIATTIVVLN